MARSYVAAVLDGPTSETPVSIAAKLTRISTPEIFEYSENIDVPESDSNQPGFGSGRPGGV